MLVILTILCLFISLLDVLIWWRGRTSRVLIVSYASALMRMFLGNIPLPFYLRMTIGSVFLAYSISIGEILAFSIRPISSPFYMFEIQVTSRQAWWFVTMSSGEGLEHRWELPVLRYHSIRGNYNYPILGVTFLVFLHDFIRQNYHKNQSDRYPFFLIMVNYPTFLINYHILNFQMYYQYLFFLLEYPNNALKKNYWQFLE